MDVPRASVQRIQECLKAKAEVLKHFKVIQINQKVIFETCSNKILKVKA